jgi:hypothetical protein
LFFFFFSVFFIVLNIGVLVQLRFLDIVTLLGVILDIVLVVAASLGDLLLLSEVGLQ